MIKNLRSQFPRLKRDKAYAYLDNAATTLIPACVIDSLVEFEEDYRANVHRGLYPDAARATLQYEHARETIASFIGAKKDEIVFTSGATAGLNILASSLGKKLHKGDSVVLTRAEHHANLVPWQEMSKQYGFELRFLELTPDFLLDESSLTVIDETTKVVSVMHGSNTLGTLFPIDTIVAQAKKVNAITIIDAAQTISHMPINVKTLDCDFLVASGHKMYGPTGIGILYGKKERFVTLDPLLFGGDMIREVTYTGATWNDIPWKFEAGTPNISGAIGLGRAVEWIQEIGFEKIMTLEAKITQYALEKLKEIPNVRIIGPLEADERLGVISIIVKGIHPHDIAEVLGQHNVAIRAGSHCTMPLLTMLNLPGTARLSFAVYSTTDDIDRALDAIHEAMKLFNV
jgi:cysteine desulfurase/selenocysteine lyase